MDQLLQRHPWYYSTLVLKLYLLFRCQRLLTHQQAGHAVWDALHSKVAATEPHQSNEEANDVQVRMSLLTDTVCIAIFLW